MQISKNKERQLVKLYPYTDDKDISKILGLPLWTIKRVADDLGLEKEDRSWSQADINFLTRNYANLSNAELSEILGKSKMEIEHRAYQLGMQRNSSFWVNIINTQKETELMRQWQDNYNHKDHGSSRGNYLLGNILSYLYPLYKSIPEYPIGELRIDWFIQELKIGIEFHGIQHNTYSDFFHGDKFRFNEGIERDYRKSELCESLGYGLVVFWHTDEMSIPLVKAKINEVI